MWTLLKSQFHLREGSGWITVLFIFSISLLLFVCRFCRTSNGIHFYCLLKCLFKAYQKWKALSVFRLQMFEISKRITLIHRPRKRIKYKRKWIFAVLTILHYHSEGFYYLVKTYRYENKIMLRIFRCEYERNDLLSWSCVDDRNSVIWKVLDHYRVRKII